VPHHQLLQAHQDWTLKLVHGNNHIHQSLVTGYGLDSSNWDRQSDSLIRFSQPGMSS
jgi:hypothetical protein